MHMSSPRIIDRGITWYLKYWCLKYLIVSRGKYLPPLGNDSYHEHYIKTLTLPFTRRRINPRTIIMSPTPMKTYLPMSNNFLGSKTSFLNLSASDLLMTAVWMNVVIYTRVSKGKIRQKHCTTIKQHCLPRSQTTQAKTLSSYFRIAWKI